MEEFCKMSPVLNRRFGVVASVALLAALVLAVIANVAAAPASAAQQPTPGVLTTPAANLSCPTNGTSPKAATTFTIVSNQSQASYTAHETLVGQGAHTAVGKTNAIIGHLMFDSSGMPVACSRFDVDLRTLTSDNARRDNFLYHNTLQTEQYPLATFILASVQGLSKPLANGQTASFTLIGNLTIHGVTKLVSWSGTATLDGNTLKGSATTTFNMPDFDITPPVVGPVLGLSQTVRLDVDVVATKAS